MLKASWMYSVNGCTCKDRFCPWMVSSMSKRMGNSVPKRAWTRFPSSALGWENTRFTAGVSTTTGPKPSSRLFSSGTPSKLQA